MRIKRLIRPFILFSCLAIGLLAVLNMPVTSRQGVNYVVHTVRMPLYIKIIEFYNRHYHYQQLVNRVCRDCRDEQEKVLALFKWTYQNIRSNVPEDWPIIDDHVWSIIVRGYGVGDQLSDVFTTLCNYAGVEAFFVAVPASSRKRRMPLSFVKMEGKWSIWDPYHGNYFRNKEGGIADIECMRSTDSWFTESLSGKGRNINYLDYFDNLPPFEEVGLTRASIQSPLNRIIFEFTKRRQ